MLSKELRIVFMGTPDFAVASLDAIYKEGYTIAGVVTVPDRTSGRGLKLNSSEVKTFANNHQLLLLQPDNLKDDHFISALKSLKPDIIVVVAFRMLPEVVWRIPPSGTINLHASLLPDYRGAAPINRAIMNGETETGLTTFFINEEIDKGKILLQEKIKILPDDTAGILHDKMKLIGAKLLLKTIYEITVNNCPAIEQDLLLNKYKKINTAPKILKNDCQINWEKGISNIYNLIRGLSPYPAAFSWLLSPEGNKYFLKIYTSKAIPEQINVPAGSIFTDKKSFLRVVSTDGLIDLHEIQLTGRKKMSVTEFLRGFPLTSAWKMQ